MTHRLESQCCTFFEPYSLSGIPTFDSYGIKLNSLQGGV